MGEWMVRKERATVANKRGWKKERVTGIWMLASRPRGPFHLPLSDYENPSPRKTQRVIHGMAAEIAYITPLTTSVLAATGIDMTTLKISIDTMSAL